MGCNTTLDKGKIHEHEYEQSCICGENIKEPRVQNIQVHTKQTERGDPIHDEAN